MPYKESEKEEIDILSVENEIERVEFEKFKNGLKQDLFLIVNLGVDINIENKIKKRKKFLNDFAKEVKEALCTGKVKYNKPLVADEMIELKG